MAGTIASTKSGKVEYTLKAVIRLSWLCMECLKTVRQITDIVPL